MTTLLLLAMSFETTVFAVEYHLGLEKWYHCFHLLSGFCVKPLLSSHSTFALKIIYHNHNLFHLTLEKKEWREGSNKDRR